MVEEIAANSRRPVMIAAMFIDPNDPRRVFQEFSEIEAARSRGRELWGQVGCFPLGMEFTVAHPYPLEALIAWRPAIEAEGSEAFRRVLADPSFRAGVKAEAKTTTGVPNRFSYHSFEHMHVKEVTRPEHKELVGKNVARLARDAKKDPFDWLLDFALDGEMEAMVDCKLFNTDEDNVRHLLRHPHAAVALSDAGAHLSFLCDAGFGLHLFGHWVRERGDLSLEEAVRAVTSRPAEAYRIKDRGRLVPGAFADLLLFDPKTVGRGEKRRVFDLPAGASRMDTAAHGVEGVWVNGVRTVGEDGPLASCGRPGKLLRDFAA
jgi:N-acyl-D-amino-acid deacylase